jgi:putative ABC transport system permease protein
VGDVLAHRMGWKLGQTVPLMHGPVQRNGSRTWYFHIDGIYDADLPEGYKSLFIAKYEYVNESIADTTRQNSVDQFISLVADPGDAGRVARVIDQRFDMNTPQTMTISEQEAVMSGLRMFGDIGAIVMFIGTAVFFSMLLITGNTMANSVRERVGQIALMRALGFGRARLVMLVLEESLIVTGTGAVLGLLLGGLLCHAAAPYITGILQAFGLTGPQIAAAIGIAVVFSLITGLLPGRKVTTLAVAETLRRL